MFSFFKRKTQETGSHAELRQSVEKWRSEIGDDTFLKSIELNSRVNRLTSVNLDFIQSLLELTDELTDRIREQYQGFGQLVLLEIDAFCAALVATAVITTDIPEDEALEVIDIYLGLWTETTVENHPRAEASALKARMDTLWLEYSRLILKTFGEPTPEMAMNEDSPARILVRNVDRLAKVERQPERELVTAVIFKAAVSESIRIVAAHVDRNS